MVRCFCPGAKQGFEITDTLFSKEALDCCGALAILAVRKESGNLITNPPSDTLLELGDELVVIGTNEQLRTLGGMV